MKFHLLGPVRVADGERPVALAGAKTRAVLAILLIHANSVVSVDRLIEELWGDQPPPTANGTLHAYISRLRRVLGPGVLVTQRPGYQLVVDPDEVDALRFERLVEQGRAAARAGRPQQAVASLRLALDLWRGPCMEEFAYERFAAAEIARLDGLRAAALEECLGAELALGRHCEVVEDLRQVVAEYPDREGMWCHLMLALYRCGRQVEALDAYHAARTRLADELAVEPGPQLRAMQCRVLRQDPTLSWTPSAPLPSVLAHAERDRFVGRTEELGRLQAAWQRTRQGCPSLVFLTGEPGAGKSTLAEHMALAAHADGGLVLWGRALRNSLAPYEPFAEALRDYLDRSGADVATRLGPEASYLGLLVPGLPDVPSASTLEPRARRYRMFEAVATLLRAAAVDAPVLLVLDDLHCADRSTGVLLDHLVRHPRRVPIMILCVSRGTELDPQHHLAAQLAALRADGLVEQVCVGGLDVGEVARLVGSITGTTAPDGLVDAIHERTGGNPLFVEEMVRELGACGADGELAMRRLSVPERIRDVIAARLARLPAIAGEVLGAASAIGQQFTLDVLVPVLDLPELSVVEVLDRAVVAGVVREDDDSPGRYVFSHPLVHEVLYHGMSTTRRASLHQRLGDILRNPPSGGSRGSSAELARHFRESAIRDANRAVQFAVDAGDEATGLLGFAEAATHYEQALDLLPLADPGDRAARRAGILLALGRVRLAEYDVAGARRSYLEAAQLALERESPGDLATAVLGVACGIEFGDVDPETVCLLEKALGRPDGLDPLLRARLLVSLARALPAGDPRVAPLAREASAIAQDVDDRDTRAFVLATGLLATWAPDNTDERVAVAGEVIRLSDELGWMDLAMEGHNWRSAAMQERGEVRAAQADLSRLAELAGQARRPFYSATLAMRRGSQALAEGRYEDAARFDAQMLADGGGGRNFRSVYSVHMFQLHRDLGRLADIEVSATAAVESAPDIPAWRPTYALLQLELGNHQVAEAELGRLVTHGRVNMPRDWLWLGALGHLAEVCASLADTDRAATLLRVLRPYARCNIVVANGALSMGSAARHLGLLCTTLGRFDDAERYFRTAIEVNTAWNAQPWLVRTYLGYAQLLRQRGNPGDDAQARRYADRGCAIAARLGMAVAAYVPA